MMDHYFMMDYSTFPCHDRVSGHSYLRTDVAIYPFTEQSVCRELQHQVLNGQVLVQIGYLHVYDSAYIILCCGYYFFYTHSCDMSYI